MKDEEKAVNRSGRDEMNLCSLPFARMGTKDKRIQLEDNGTYMGVDSAGNSVQRKYKWSVHGGLHGLPTEFGERVLVALMVIAHEQGFENQRMQFTIYEVLQILGVKRNTRAYEDVKTAIQQLLEMTIYHTDAWVDGRTRKRVSSERGFHLIDMVVFHDEDGAIDGKSGVKWGDVLWESIQNGYIKQLDIDTYYSFKGAIARRLYRFLDKLMAYQDEYQVDIYALQSKLGLTNEGKVSITKRKLAKATDELVAEGYLGSYEFIKVGKYHRIKFLKPTAVLQNELQAKLFDEDFDLELTSEEPDAEQGIEWGDVLVQLKMRNPQFAGALKRTGLISFEGGVLTIDGGLYAKKLAGWVNDGTLARCLTGIMGREVVEVAVVAVVDGSHEKVDRHGQSPSVV